MSKTKSDNHISVKQKILNCDAYTYDCKFVYLISYASNIILTLENSQDWEGREEGRSDVEWSWLLGEANEE